MNIRSRPPVPRAVACLLLALAAGCDGKSNGAADAGIGPAPDAAPVPADAAPRPDAAIRPDAAAPDAAAPDAATADAATADAIAPDAAAPDAGPAGPLAPPAASAAPPLFDPAAPGAAPIDAPIASVLEAWQTLPTDEASAQAHAQRLREGFEAIAAGGAEAADRIAEVCAAVPVHAVGPTMECLRLLSIVDSPRSLDLLADRAREKAAPYPTGAHPHDPPPEALAAQVALRALVDRSRAGTPLASDLLVRLSADPENPNRGDAVAATLRALPRAIAKRRLRAALPPEEHYRLYQTR